MNWNEATREILWNIDGAWVMYLLFFVTLVIGGYGFYRRISVWRAGEMALRFDRPASRIRLLILQALGQARTLKEAYPGSSHFFVFTGFIVLTIATVVVMLDYDLGTQIMTGSFYLYFQSLVVDVFGVYLLAGIGMALLRRWIARPKQLIMSVEASLILVLIFAIGLTGFLVEGWRIAVTEDPWGAWSPAGFGVAVLSKGLFGAATLEFAHKIGWWFHLLLAFGFLAWIPYTKLLHIFSGPLSIFTANLDGHGKTLKAVDFESETAPLGVNEISQFTWRDLLELDACTECGRCTASCPANSVGKSLSPRDIILDLRNHMHAKASVLLTRGGSEVADDSGQLVGLTPALSSDALWACTTCAACMEACPVYIEQLSKIIDLRRHLAMEEAEIPEGQAAALTSLEKRGHPFPGTRFSRIDWTDGLGIQVLSEMESPDDIDTLLWVGCAGALLERNQKVIRALAQLLQEAGVRFAILGREERCTGDPARRAGNEFLFEMIAQKNIELLRRYKVERIVTACPHCFNTFVNDYPRLGGSFDVVDHSTFLAGLVADGQLQLNASSGVRMTFHDPCYLGRYHRKFSPPRQILERTTQRRVEEMALNREFSFCCGGGGAMSFAEEPPNQRVNRERAKQAMGTGAETVTVACPFCMTMLEDGVASNGNDSVEVLDVAEVLWNAIGKEASG